MDKMSDIRYYLLTDAMRPLTPSIDKKDMEGQPLWLEEFVPGAFRLRSAEDIQGNELEDTGLACPNCGRQLKAISRQRTIYLCSNCRRKVI